MKLSVIFVLIFAAVFGFVASAEFSCTPNETYKDDCNTCKCNESGTFAVCTQRACYHGPIYEDTVTKASTDGTTSSTESVSQTNQVCTPNEIKMEDCNRCKCANNGIGWFCTRKLCPKFAERLTPNVAVNEPTFRCVPYESFREDCNTCFCDASGKLARCTLMACPPKQKRAVATKSTSHCNPGQKWNDGCNDCWCTETGFAACTMRFCFNTNDNLMKVVAKRSTPSQECTPGTSWKQDCNNCFCTETGIAACTLKGCLKMQETIYASSQQSGNSYPDRRFVTMAEYESPDFSCTPLETFKLECNTCKCSQDGKKVSWCTKKFCIPEEKLV